MPRQEYPLGRCSVDVLVRESRNRYQKMYLHWPAMSIQRLHTNDYPELLWKYTLNILAFFWSSNIAPCNAQQFTRKVFRRRTDSNTWFTCLIGKCASNGTRLNLNINYRNRSPQIGFPMCWVVHQLMKKIFWYRSAIFVLINSVRNISGRWMPIAWYGPNMGNR